jgi:HEAT repeat protein
VSENAPPSNGYPPDPDQSVDESASPRLVAQFVVFPLAIVIVGAALYMLLGLLTEEDRAPKDFLNGIRTGGINSRWQAAFELSRQLSSDDADALEPGFANEIVRVFEDAKPDDPRVRQYLAVAMGRVQRPDVIVPALIEALEDPDPTTRIYAAMSLGAQKDRRALEPLKAMLASDDAGLRKVAVHALGEIDAVATAPLLRSATRDPVADVRWNAALQLAKAGDASGIPVLREMISRPNLDAIKGMTPEQKGLAMVGAIRALEHLGAKETAPLLEELKRSDPDMKVRQAAIEALASLK